MPKSNFIIHVFILFLTEIGDRRFCLVHSLTNMTSWSQSKEWCETSWSGGRLAVDNSSDAHKVLLDLMKDLNISEAWLGASTKPLYWNWISTETGFSLNSMIKCQKQIIHYLQGLTVNSNSTTLQ